MASRYTIFSLDDPTVKKLNAIVGKVKVGGRKNRSLTVRAIIDFCSDDKYTKQLVCIANELAAAFSAKKSAAKKPAKKAKAKR